MCTVAAAWQECIQKIPGVMLRVRSVTTSSIYAKTPDGYSLRIGDHKGIEKWAYKWNLDLKKSEWRTDHKGGKHIARYYTNNVDDLAKEIKSSFEAKQDLRSSLDKATLALKIAVAALEEIEAGCLFPESTAVLALRGIQTVRQGGVHADTQG
jgi:hypothetical protein